MYLIINNNKIYILHSYFYYLIYEIHNLIGNTKFVLQIHNDMIQIKGRIYLISDNIDINVSIELLIIRCNFKLSTP